MTNRSANATIKGYIYQFDHAIFQLLSLNNEDQIVTIEGVEDVDITSDNYEEVIQCKYYEQTEYNHSVIKPAVIAMLKHFKAENFESKFQYRLYGHYKSGQDKLELPLTLDFLKTNFLKYEEKGVSHKVWEELSINDTELQKFISLLEIDNQAESYDAQMNLIYQAIKNKISNCTQDDLEHLYYPAALNEIRKLAIESDIKNRRINGRSFLAKINIKNKLFDNWHIAYLSEEKYTKYLSQKYFKNITGTSLQKAARFFLIEYDKNVSLSEYLECIKKIADRFSNKEHVRTSHHDRFCPYLFLVNIDSTDLINLKKQLQLIGLNFIDGIGFLGADFDVDRICTVPHKYNKLKFLNNIEEFNQAITYDKHKQSIYTFEFYLTTEISSIAVNESIVRNKIKVSNISSIKDIIK